MTAELQRDAPPAIALSLADTPAWLLNATGGGMPTASATPQHRLPPAPGTAVSPTNAAAAYRAARLSSSSPPPAAVVEHSPELSASQLAEMALMAV
eukprot:3505709-Prymnesium_polylepis.1